MSKNIDPACGSGNFLTETYIELRALENEILGKLVGDQMAIEFQEEEFPSFVKVNVGQFYGIEINDFAVSVANTALWIADHQSNLQTARIINRPVVNLPLKKYRNIVQANALRTDWNEVLPAGECDFIMGNPPFIGYSNLDQGQKEERLSLFGKAGGVLDYVACWYKKSADYIGVQPVRCAFVSTNSICQGQQVAALWKPLFEDGIAIDFAHQSFVWGSEAADMAHVHVMIVGFSKGSGKQKLLYSKGSVIPADHINAYLVDAPDAFIKRRTKPICDTSPMVRGCQPTDDGNLILSPEEKTELLTKYPDLAKWVKPFSMGAEFINAKDRYCLWFVGISPRGLRDLPQEIRNRIAAVKEMRLSSTKAATRKKAETPWLFDEVRPPEGDSYIAVPKVSSERRVYIPIGFVENGMIPGDKLFYISNAGLYEFGILTSQFHNAWMRTVTGRLKSDYSYSNTIVYNNFIWPKPDPAQKKQIKACAQSVLDVRSLYPDSSLADLYDPDFMPSDLRDIHKALDKAVEQAYGVNFNGDEEKIVAYLFELYDSTIKQYKEDTRL